MFRKLFPRGRAMSDVRTMATLLPAAERIAQSQGLSQPSAEHLLLAACALPDGTATGSLQRVGVTQEDLRVAVAGVHSAALGALGISGDDTRIEAALPPAPDRPHGVYRSEVSAQDVFHRAVALAKADGSPLLGAHVVLAATEQEQGTVPRALAQLHVGPDELRDAARAELTGARAG